MMLISFQTVKMCLGIGLGDSVVIDLLCSFLKDPRVISSSKDGSRDQALGHMLRKIVKFFDFCEGDSWFLVSEAPIQTQM